MCEYCCDSDSVKCIVEDECHFDGWNSGVSVSATILDGATNKLEVAVSIMGREVIIHDAAINYCPMCGRKL